MALLVEYRLLDKLKVINEGTGPNKKLKVKGKFQKCDEQNNNGRTYPRKVLESQVNEIQDKIKDRALVGALDHPPNDAIHLSQASHLITKLWVEPNGDVMGEAEILSTPSGKIVEALLNDGVKIGISSRGLGTISELKNAKVVNEDFKLITFDLVSDPSTKGAFPELTEATKLNSQKAQNILTKMKKDKVLLTVLEQKINEAINEARKPRSTWDATDAIKDKKATRTAFNSKPKPMSGKHPTAAKIETPTTDIEDFKKKFAARMKQPEGRFKESKLAAEMAEILREGLVKKANKNRKKDWEKAGFMNAGSDAKALTHSRNSEFPGSDDPSSPSKTKSRRFIHTLSRGVTNKVKRSQESKLAAEMAEILREGLVKKANKIKKGNFEDKMGGNSSTTVYAGSKHKTDKDINKLKARKDRNRFTRSPADVAADAKSSRQKRAYESISILAELLKESLSKKSKKSGNELFNNFNKSNTNVKGKGRKAVDGHVDGKITKK